MVRESGEPGRSAEPECADRFTETVGGLAPRRCRARTARQDRQRGRFGRRRRGGRDQARLDSRQHGFDLHHPQHRDRGGADVERRHGGALTGAVGVVAGGAHREEAVQARLGEEEDAEQPCRPARSPQSAQVCCGGYRHGPQQKRLDRDGPATAQAVRQGRDWNADQREDGGLGRLEERCAVEHAPNLSIRLNNINTLTKPAEYENEAGIGHRSRLAAETGLGSASLGGGVPGAAAPNDSPSPRRAKRADAPDRGRTRPFRHIERLHSPNRATSANDLLNPDRFRSKTDT